MQYFFFNTKDYVVQYTWQPNQLFSLQFVQYNRQLQIFQLQSSTHCDVSLTAFFHLSTFPTLHIGIFLGEIPRNMIHEEEWKKLFGCSQVVFGPGAVWGIFWPEKGWRPSEGQKNLQTAQRLKQGWLEHNIFFVIPNDEMCPALTSNCQPNS